MSKIKVHFFLRFLIIRIIALLADPEMVSTSLATKSDGTKSHNQKGPTASNKFIATERTNSRSSGLEVICEKTST